MLNTRRGFLTTLILGAIELMSSWLWNFPRRLSSPFFDEAQDKALRHILGWFKNNELDPSIEAARLNYIVEDNSDPVNFPNDVTFTDSPGSTAIGTQANVVVTSSDAHLDGFNTDVTVTNSNFVRVKNCNDATISSATRTDVDGLFNPFGSGYQAVGTGSNKKVFFLPNSTSSTGISQKIVVPVQGSIRTIYESTTTAPHESHWQTIATASYPTSTKITDPYFFIVGKHTTNVAFVSNAIAGNINVGLEEGMFRSTIDLDADSMSSDYTSILSSPTSGGAYMLGPQWPTTGGTSRVAFRVSRNGLNELILQAACFVPSGATNNAIYSLTSTDLLELIGEMEIIVTQNGWGT